MYSSHCIINMIISSYMYCYKCHLFATRSLSIDTISEIWIAIRKLILCQSTSIFNFIICSFVCSSYVHFKSDKSKYFVEVLAITSLSLYSIIQLCSGITHGRVFIAELYAQRLQKLIYLHLLTDCFMKISLPSSEQTYRLYVLGYLCSSGKLTVLVKVRTFRVMYNHTLVYVCKQRSLFQITRSHKPQSQMGSQPGDCRWPG